MSAMGCYPNRDGKDRLCSSQKWSVEILLNSTDRYLNSVSRQALCLHRCSLEVFEHQNTKIVRKSAESQKK